jgi:hypothetical protein
LEQFGANAEKIFFSVLQSALFMVGDSGFEPLTPAV